MTNKQRFESLESQKEKMLADLCSWSEARLQFRPEPASWSALDVLDHLVKVETAFVSQVEKNLAAKQRVKAMERLRGVMVCTVMRTPMKVQVPSAAARVLPTPGDSLVSLTTRWKDARHQMAGVIGRLEPQTKFGVFRHPVSGWMDMAGAMTFLFAHVRHHEFQLNRLKTASRL